MQVNFEKENMQVKIEKEEFGLIKHSSPDGILSVDDSKDSISVQSKNTSVHRSFHQRSYSVTSFSLSTEEQLYEEEEGSTSILRNLLCLLPFVSLAVNKNKKGVKTSWEIPSNFIHDLTEIGSGAHGCVYRGFLHGEVVAVKEARGEFKADVKLLKKLKHLNIIKMIGMCTDSSNVRIVMEYCPFGSLYDELHSGADILPRKVLNWAMQIADGMNYLHKHRVIHRDLKSPNILISYNDVLKITDFDISCRWDGFSTEMPCYGTYRWMAPEVIKNELCSEKVDIWSYGVVLWELLTSEVPYKNLEALQVMYGVGNNSLHLCVPQTFPESFKYLLSQCWNRNPAERPSFQSILKHLQLKTTTEEMNNFDIGEYHVLLAGWKSEINPERRRFKSSSSSSESNGQTDTSYDLVIKLWKKMFSVYDLLCYKEQAIFKCTSCLKASMVWSIVLPEFSE